MTDQTLLMLFDEVRGKTLRLIDVPEARARWTPPGTRNSILWHAGHAYCVVERLALGVLHESGLTPHTPQYPDGWWELFSWDSRPETARDDAWPPLEDVAAALRDQHARLRPVFAGLTDPQLVKPWPATGPDRGRHTVRRMIVHALHDEASHGGEIWLLRKLGRMR